MNPIYIELEFVVEPLQLGTEILIAELGYAGFESFTETDRGVKAYIQKSEWNEKMLDDIHILSSDEFQITFQKKEIEQVNWNAEWEKNFNPILVGDRCVVRAPFHQPTHVPYEIIIEPKMSFGTGHHETTWMMLRYILENDFDGKTVLDMGCGTAVLAILAEMTGATEVDAIDIDFWCVENSRENVEHNSCKQISVYQGDASVIDREQQYDIILANINRNILLNDMENYVSVLRRGGQIFLSGFYLADLAMITETCKNHGLQFVAHQQKNAWVAAKFVN